MTKKTNFKPLFTRKPQEFLMNLPLHRLSAYHRVLQKTVRKAVPWCCENMCFEDWESDAHKEWWTGEHAYVMFVKAILKSRSIVSKHQCIQGNR